MDVLLGHQSRTPRSSETVDLEEIISFHDEELTSELLDLLGEDPEAKTVKIILHSDLVKRWSFILKYGFDKDNIIELISTLHLKTVPYQKPQN